MLTPIVEAGPLHVLVEFGPWHLHFWPADGFASWSYQSLGLGMRVVVGRA